MTRQSQRGVSRAAAATASLILVMVMTPAEARGGHGFHHGGGGQHGEGSFAGDRHHANDAYVNAATQEEDKLLNTKIKSICRGC
jgi:hypothetical protein